MALESLALSLSLDSSVIAIRKEFTLYGLLLKLINSLERLKS